MATQGAVLVTLAVLPRLCTDALKARGVHPLLPIALVAFVTTAYAFRSVTSWATIKSIPVALGALLVACDGYGDKLLVRSQAHPDMSLRDVQVISRFQVVASLAVTLIMYAVTRDAALWRVSRAEFLSVVICAAGIWLYLADRNLLGLDGPVMWVLASRIIAEVTAVCERLASRKYRAQPADLLLLTNVAVPLLLAAEVPGMPPAGKDAVLNAVVLTLPVIVGTLGAFVLPPALTAALVAAASIAVDVDWVSCALLAANVAGATLFLVCKAQYRAEGMTPIGFNLWMAAAFAVTVTLGGSGGSVVSLLLVCASVLVRLW